MGLDSNEAETADRLFYSALSIEPDLAELVNLFVEELPQRLSQMEESWRESDMSRLARTAHQLKGAPSVIQASRSVYCCEPVPKTKTGWVSSWVGRRRSAESEGVPRLIWPITAA